jgi:SAM-dependent methyltransferase
MPQPDTKTISASSAWDQFHRRWARLKPPLRPHADVVAALTAAIAGHESDILLLGVTPELADIGRATTAADHSASMIERIWPGDTDRRRALLADWLALQMPAASFSAAIGDGSLNVISLTHHPALFAELHRVLTPGARLAVRVYAMPEPCESIAALRAAVMEGQAPHFHAFKWRLAMAVAAEGATGDVPVALIHQTFTEQLPDPGALLRATGWSSEDLAEMEAYRGQEVVLCFPTRPALLAALAPAFVNARFVPSGRYALAERCPILIANKA